MTAPVVMTDIPIGTKQYTSIVKQNFDALAAAVNDLAAQLLAVSGDGAQLLLHTWDRSGIVGTTSYRLDIPNYSGGSQIVIGRRPAFDSAKQEQDLSIAFHTYGGQKTMVTKPGDTTLDAASITTGLPKTIYVGVISDGTPQLFEDNTNPEVLYIYSMCWDGFSLTCFKYEAPILLSEETLQDLANSPTTERIFDTMTDWLSHTRSRSSIVLAGDGGMSETGINISKRVVGGFFATGPGDKEGFWCPAGTDSILKLELWDDQDRRWNLEDIEIDVKTAPTRFFFRIDPALGDDRYITDVTEFRLVRVSIGGDIASVRGFTWGLQTIPVIGAPIPKNEAKIRVF